MFYDSADAATVEDIRHFQHSFLAEEESMHGWEITLISPIRFASSSATEWSAPGAIRSTRGRTER